MDAPHVTPTTTTLANLEVEHPYVGRRRLAENLDAETQQETVEDYDAMERHVSNLLKEYGDQGIVFDPSLFSPGFVRILVVASREWLFDVFRNAVATHPPNDLVDRATLRRAVAAMAASGTTPDAQ
jgi:hypothetical protein